MKGSQTNSNSSRPGMSSARGRKRRQSTSLARPDLRQRTGSESGPASDAPQQDSQSPGPQRHSRPPPTVPQNSNDEVNIPGIGTSTAHPTAQVDITELQEKLRQVYASRDSALSVANEYKEKCSDLTKSVTHLKVNNELLVQKVSSLTSEITALKQECDGLKKLNMTLKATSATKHTQRAKFVDRVQKTLDERYISLAILVDAKICKWAAAQTMEVVLSDDNVKIRDWTNRIEVVTDYGVRKNLVTEGFFLYVPLLVSEVLSSIDVFYIRSYDSVESVISSITGNILNTSEEWIAFCRSASQKTETIQALSTDKTLISRVKQSLSDSVSNRKRLVRDELFCCLNYFSLKSSHDRRHGQPLHSKLEELKMVQDRLLGDSTSSSTPEPATISALSRWRTTPLDKLTSDSTFPEMFINRNFRQDEPQKILEENSDDEEDNTGKDERYEFTCMGIHRNSLSFNLWTIFLGFDPYEDEDNVTEVSFYSIPRLDAWIATFIELLQEKEQRGGGRQKHYSQTFARNMRLATFSLIDRVFNFVNYWCPHELTAPDPDCADPKTTVLELEREATILLHSQKTSTFYIAVKSSWFTDFISPNCGVVHDCVIAMVSPDWRDIIQISSQNNGILKSDGYQTNSAVLTDNPEMTDVLPINSSDTANESQITVPPLQ